MLTWTRGQWGASPDHLHGFRGITPEMAGLRSDRADYLGALRKRTTCLAKNDGRGRRLECRGVAEELMVSPARFVFAGQGAHRAPAGSDAKRALQPAAPASIR